MIIQEYLDRVAAVYKTGVATEHSYRSAIEFLFKNLSDDIKALNEPKRVQCGAPDFIVQRGEITIGHIEAKDIGVDLAHMKDRNKEQKNRYRKGLPNLVYTNCLDFEFFREGELVARVSVAEPLMGIQPKPENFERLENLLKEFIAQRPQTITSSKTLASMMAGKALLIKDVFANVLADDTETELHGQYSAFQEHLIHDISKEDFADIYAETIAYGMFAARLHDDSLEDFSRREALELLPKSNPFLRKLFSFVAGQDLDDRIRWIIDELADVFQACDVREIMASFGKLTGRKDPFIHFYEDFLEEYNPKKRKERGVWYTPEPVVNFIVRAVDDVLKSEFGLPLGLADNSKIIIDWDTGQKETTKKGKIAKSGKNAIGKREVHRVQILDPATGTGTFLAEVIKQIAPRIKDVGEGMWSPYIENELIPRLHGFELLMASYAMCHMKLDMVLTALGYKPTKTPPRLSVYLTNSLEEGEAANQTLPFAQWLSNEVREANTIKRDMPIMCIIGNPPYSGVSQNMGPWITGLIEDYKYVDGEHFNERKHWLHDDYVKFIRMSENLIEKNGEGILGFITNHGYLDNPTFRGMRWHLLKTFDKIFILDLHGNTKKKETTPEGKPDKNVFNIQQGVAIIIAIKKCGNTKGMAEVLHGDLWGPRELKYKSLFQSSLASSMTTRPDCEKPLFSFSSSGSEVANTYNEGFKLTDFFLKGSMGVQTSRDGLAIAYTKEELVNRLEAFSDAELTDDQIRDRFFSHKKKGKYLQGDSRSWSVSKARKNITIKRDLDLLTQINYRPFDQRFTFYSKELLDWPREPTMVHFLRGENLSLLFPRQLANLPYNHAFVTESIAEMCVISNRTKEQNAVFPLYLYPDEDELDQTRRVNFDSKIYKTIQGAAEHPAHGTADEMAVFDYIYGVLYSPDYRETYKEFLKSDFPRIPYPTTPDVFRHVAEKGGQLRRLHLMEDAAIGATPYPFKGEGDTMVDKPAFAQTDDTSGRVHINADQYFEGVPQIAWEFYIGSYQPAQKWLKDRKGRTLDFNDVQHYQKIIKILSETDRIMKEIKLPL